MSEEKRAEHVVGMAVLAAAAFAVGAAAGMAMGGAIGAVHGRRVRDTLERLARPRAGTSPGDLEEAVRSALRDDEATSDLDIEVHVANGGLVELTGVVSDAVVRRAAADVARAVLGVEVVVNRIMLRDPGSSPQQAPDLRPA